MQQLNDIVDSKILEQYNTQEKHWNWRKNSSLSAWLISDLEG